MDSALTALRDEVVSSEFRTQILHLESDMVRFLEERDLPRTREDFDKLCPLKHTFAPGGVCKYVYAREIFIPAGTAIVGKIHKHAHLNMLMKGKVTVATEDGRETLEGPLTMVSTAGTKRAVYAHTDTVWVTVHLTNDSDLEKIEEEIIAKDYQEFEAFMKPALDKP